MTVNFSSAIFESTADTLKNGFLSSLTFMQKKVVLIAAIAFGVIGTCYAINRYFLKKNINFLKKPFVAIKNFLIPDEASIGFSFYVDHGKKTKELAFSSYTIDRKSLLDIIARVPNLEELVLLNGLADDGVLDQIKTHPSLKKLVLDGVNITDSGLKALSAMTSLQDVDLRNSPHITDNGLKSFESLKTLKSLRLNRCQNITDRGLKSLKSLVSLESLDFSNDSKISGWGLKYLTGLPLLNSLNLRGCYQFSDAGLAHISHIKSLKFLDIRECCAITDVGLQHLTNYTYSGSNKYLHLKLGCGPYGLLIKTGPTTSTSINNKFTYANFMELTAYHNVDINDE